MDDWAKIMQKLDTPERLDWITEFRLGRKLYDYLMSEIGAGRVNENQTVSGMYALFRLRGVGSDQQVFQLLLDLMTATSIQVRSAATRLALVWVLKISGNAGHGIIASIGDPRLYHAVIVAEQLGLAGEAPLFIREYRLAIKDPSETDEN